MLKLWPTIVSNTPSLAGVEANSYLTTAIYTYELSRRDRSATAPSLRSDALRRRGVVRAGPDALPSPFPEGRGPLALSALQTTRAESLPVVASRSRASHVGAALCDARVRPASTIMIIYTP